MDLRRFLGSPAQRRFLYIRLGVVALCLLAFLVLPGAVERRSLGETRDRVLSFKLPLPEDYATRYGVERVPDVESVHVTGIFARWKTDNPAFRMRRTGPQEWSITIPFPKGTTQYKYVIKVRGRSSPLWIQDVSNPHSMADGFGGINSTVTIGAGPSPGAIRLVSGSVAAAVAFYSLLSLALRLLGHFRLTSTQRALFIFCLVLIVAGLVAGLYAVDSQRRLARQAYLEISDMVCLVLEGQGLDVTGLEGSAGMARANAAFDSFFREARLRTNPGGPTGAFSSVSQIVLFSAGMKTIAVSDRFESSIGASTRTDAYLLNQTYSDSMFKRLLAQEARLGDYALEGAFGLLPKAHWGKYGSYASSSRLLGFNAAIFPMVRDLKTIGYLGLIISPQVYGGQIGATVVFHCLWIAGLLLCSLFLFLYKPTASELSPGLVDEFVRRHGLTPRESELIGALVAGQDYQTIADKNFISLKTVKTHVHNIYKKAEVGNRLELVEAIRQRK